MSCMLGSRGQGAECGGCRRLAPLMKLAHLDLVAVLVIFGTSHGHLAGGLMPCLLWVRDPIRECL